MEQKQTIRKYVFGQTDEKLKTGSGQSRQQSKKLKNRRFGCKIRSLKVIQALDSRIKPPVNHCMLTSTCGFEPLQGKLHSLPVDNRLSGRNGNVSAGKTGNMQSNSRQDCFRTIATIVTKQIPEGVATNRPGSVRSPANKNQAETT